MAPLARHDLVHCGTCGAAPRKPCAGSRTCLERIWRAINRWFADYHAEVRQVPCPVKGCGAQPGEECSYPANKTNLHQYRGAGLYGTESHKARILAAEKEWKEAA